MQAVLKKSDGCSCLRYAMAMVGAMLGTAVMAQPVSTKPTAASAAQDTRGDMREAPGTHLSYPPGKPFHLDQVGGIAINPVNHTGYAIPAEQCIGNEVATFDTRTKTAGPSINDPVLVNVCSQAIDNTDKQKSILWVGTGEGSVVPIDVTNNKNTVGTPITMPASTLAPYGGDVVGIAINPSTKTGFALVDSENQEAVVPFNLKSGIVGQPVKVSGPGDNEEAMVMDDAGQTLYLTSQAGGLIIPVDVSGEIPVVKTPITVGGHPPGMAVDSTKGYLYVINGGPEVIPVRLGSSHAVEKAIPLGGETDSIAVDEAIHTLYVGDAEDGALHILDTNNLYKPNPPTIMGMGPEALAVDPTTNTVYLGSAMSGAIGPITPVATPVQATFPASGATVSANEDITVKGTGEPYATVRVSLRDQGPHRRSFTPVVVGPDGKWSVEVGKLPAMKVNARVTQTYAHLAPSTYSFTFAVAP